MQATVERLIKSISSKKDQKFLGQLLRVVADRLSSQALTSAGLVIKAGGGVLAKTGGSTTYLVANGAYRSIAAATDMPALTGLTIGANKFNVACFFIDQNGTVTVLFGTEGATAAAVKWPNFPAKKALVGALMITHSSAFTGNTTPLDTATTVYLSPTGAVDPSVLLD